MGTSEPHFQDLAEATEQTRKLLGTSTLMWSLGYVIKVLQEVPLPESPAGQGQLLMWRGLITIVMLVCLVLIAISARRAAIAFDLPSPNTWLAAWVPCVNPFAVISMLALWYGRMSECQADKSLFFASRERLDAEL